MRSRWWLALLAGLFALVTACGGGGDGGDGIASVSSSNPPTSAGEDQGKGDDVDKMREYAKCMRDHGVDMADPETNGGGIGISVNGGDKEKVDKANTSCKKLLPNGGEPPKPTAKDLDKMREQAKCLREQGIDVPDPTMEKPYIDIEAGDDVDKVNEAMKKCGGDGQGSVSVHEGEGK